MTISSIKICVPCLVGTFGTSICQRFRLSKIPSVKDSVCQRFRTVKFVELAYFQNLPPYTDFRERYNMAKRMPAVRLVRRESHLSQFLQIYSALQSAGPSLQARLSLKSYKTGDAVEETEQQIKAKFAG